jgi:DNA-binding MarR family transcriptional regulator
MVEVTELAAAPADRAALEALVDGPLGTISERMGDLVRDFVRLRAHFAAASELDSEWALNRLIVTLVRVGPMRLMALATAAQCDSSTVSRQVGTLVAKGFIERLPDPADGRAILLRPTEAAVTRYRDYLTGRVAREAEVLASWPEADRAELANLLGRYFQDFRSYYAPQLGPVHPTGDHGPAAGTPEQDSCR